MFWRRGRAEELLALGRSLMQFQDLTFSELRKMTLDLSKLKDGQSKLVSALQTMVDMVAAKNEQIATLTAKLARAQAGATPDEQAAVDAVAADLADRADKLTAALPKDPVAPAPPSPPATADSVSPSS
jgi:hypothetical protein